LITEHIVFRTLTILLSDTFITAHLNQLRERFDRAAGLVTSTSTTTVASPPSTINRNTAKIGGSQALRDHILALRALEKQPESMLLDHLTDPASFTMAAPNNFFVSSPAVALPPSQQGQFFPPGNFTASEGVGQPLFTPNGTTLDPSSGSVAGRKRSRGDIHEREDVEEAMMDDGGVPSPERQEQDTGMAVDGQPEYNHVKRPSISSRKSQRREMGKGGSDDLAQLVLPPQIREATTEPLIDEATRVLGISWTRMDATDVTRINQAAYSKWIQNHYASLKDVEVWFENSAIPGYLVKASNAYNGQFEYYIFSNDLTEARLVTSDPSQLVPRLKMLPALHLAAPGGHIRAEMDPITVSQAQAEEQIIHEASRFSKEMLQLRGQIHPDVSSAEPGALAEPVGMCAAHSMEMD